MILRALAVLLAAAPPAPQEARIATAQDGDIAVRDLVIRAGAGAIDVVFVDASGNRRSIRAEDVVEIALGGGPSAAAAARPVPEDIEAVLTTGDTIVGKAGPRSADGIQILNPAYGNPTLKIDHLRALLFPANRAYLPRQLPKKVDADLVLMKSGDRAEGTLLAVSGLSVEYRSARFERDMSVPLTEVAGVWLTEIKPPPKEPSTLFSIVFTTDGSSMRGEIQSLREGILTFKDLYGEVRRLAASNVSALSMRNGRVVYLSDLDPSSAQEDANYIRGPQKAPSDLDYPFQRDRSAKGTRIVLGGTEHRKGLGVRAHSELTYALGRAFKRFQATVGLDAAAVSLGLGAVAAEAWIDGNKAKEAVFKPGDSPQAWDLDVTGAGELKLVVTWAGSGQSDFADWGSARLIR